MIPEIPITDTNECDDNTDYGFNHGDESDDMALECTVMSRSQRTSEMFINDEQHQTTIQSTQESQQQDVEALMDTVGPKSEICLAIIREAMNKAGDDPELIDFLIEGTKKLDLALTEKMTSNSKRKEYDSSSSHISCQQSESDNNDSVVYVAGAETGKTNKKITRRQLTNGK